MKKKVTFDDLVDIENRLTEIEGTVVGVLTQQLDVIKAENERLYNTNRKQGSALIVLQQHLEKAEYAHQELINAIFDHPKVSATAKRIIAGIIEGPGEDQVG